LYCIAFDAPIENRGSIESTTLIPAFAGMTFLDLIRRFPKAGFQLFVLPNTGFRKLIAGNAEWEIGARGLPPV
jgi:hypothetical protein